MSQKIQNSLQPSHELAKEPVVVDMHFVHEFVEIVFVAGAEVDEGLDGLVWVGGDVLMLRSLDDVEHVIGKGGEVGDAVVNVGGFVHADERLIKYGKKVAEELEGYGLGELVVPR